MQTTRTDQATVPEISMYKVVEHVHDPVPTSERTDQEVVKLYDSLLGMTQVLVSTCVVKIMSWTLSDYPALVYTSRQCGYCGTLSLPCMSQSSVHNVDNNVLVVGHKNIQAQSAKADTELHIYIISFTKAFSSSTLQVKNRGKWSINRKPAYYMSNK